MGTAFRFAIELEDESGVGFGFYIQMELRRRTFGVFPYPNPAIVEHGGLRYGSREIQRHGHSAEESTGVDATGGTSTAGIDRDFETELAGEDGFSGKLVEIRLAEMEGCSNGVDVGVRKVVLRRDEGNNSGL